MGTKIPDPSGNPSGHPQIPYSHSSCSIKMQLSLQRKSENDNSICRFRHKLARLIKVASLFMESKKLIPTKSEQVESRDILKSSNPRCRLFTLRRYKLFDGKFCQREMRLWGSAYQNLRVQSSENFHVHNAFLAKKIHRIYCL